MISDSVTAEMDEKAKSPKWSYAVCGGAIAGAFLMFVFFLDRYPPFYVDEPAFNASAARHVGGQSFVYPLHTEAPHGESVWAYHGPFFPRMQVLTFRLLGVSHWACRIPSYLGGHLATLVLCLLLLRYGLWRSAIVLSIAWVGDRATQMILLGRPDGVSHLLVVIGYLSLVSALSRGSRWRLGMSATFIGLAIGFNPGAVFFGFALVVAVALWTPAREWARSVGAMAAGVVVPAVIFLACWLPSLPASFEQFRWYVYESTKGGWVASMSERLTAVWQMPFWSKYWVLALVATLPLLLLRVAMLPREGDERDRSQWLIPVTCLIFGLAAAMLYLNSSMHAFYFVFFTIWPIGGMLSLWENGGWRRWRPVFVAWSVLVTLAWLPSLMWNATRCREALLSHRALTKEGIVEDVSRYVPHDVSVTGDPAYFVVAHRAGLRFTPLPFYEVDPGLSVGDDDWCIVGSRYLAALDRQSPGWRNGRALLHTGTAFKESYSWSHNYYIFGPRSGE